MLKISDIYMGSIDAKNELLEGTDEEAQSFLAAFVVPPSLSIDKFYKKLKYYVVGLKGTGKTALLRYIALKLESQGSKTQMILFKSQIKEELRKDFSKAARVKLTEDNIDSFDGTDFEAVWRWFIYRKIVEAVRDHSTGFVEQNEQFEKFSELVNADTYGDDKKGLLARLIPKIKKGHIEISHSPKLGLDLEWDSEGKANVDFNALVQKADEAFSSLTGSNNRLNILFDELELNHNTEKQYKRDSQLIRDLIVSVESVNAVAKAKKINICIYAAIRSEVVNSVESLGKEVNKPISDFGTEILWNKPGVDSSQQPLLNIIEQRINIAREKTGLDKLTSQEVWRQYFPDKIIKLQPQVYILHNSWYRPRDIVRLLLIAQDQDTTATFFSVQAFEAIRKKYSTASWVEMTEELRSKYKPSEIDGIKSLFYGFKGISTVGELNARSVVVGLENTDAKELFKKYSVQEILRDLFRIGVIGNIDPGHNRNMRFSFRGDDEIIFSKEIFVHNALRAHLSLQYGRD
ncbi:hypothetical protein G8E10_00695 [Rhizobiaceae bacterium CRRU44]|uniref:Uncharacterized protein n=1 Tax=Ferranicluibacter rubi TaxID=2715133 RepID=A0AA44CAT0_9HYPH|nr:hypothetical protein [Ferranicluibacter rubi]NHT74267.1 hypothetical protein [Ferranicluibacter rubi]